MHWARRAQVILIPKRAAAPYVLISAWVGIRLLGSTRYPRQHPSGAVRYRAAPYTIPQIQQPMRPGISSRHIRLKCIRPQGTLNPFMGCTGTQAASSNLHQFNAINIYSFTVPVRCHQWHLSLRQGEAVHVFCIASIHCGCDFPGWA
jgi:hypothetical protein